MAAPHTHWFTAARRPAASVFTPALLVSLVVHAGIGGLLIENWRHPAVEPVPTLTVKFEAVPPVIVESPAPPVVKPPKPAPKARAVTQRAPQISAPPVMAVERVDLAPTTAAAPIVEMPPAPTVVAKAPAPVNAPRSEAIEPPHFDVAYLNNPRPAYPPIARKLGLEGVVLLRVDVSAKGTPQKITVAQTSGASLLDEAAMKAVQGWTFVPARRGDAAIAHPVEVPIRFQLKN